MPSGLPLVSKPIDSGPTLNAIPWSGRWISGKTITRSSHLRLDWLELADGTVLSLRGNTHLGLSHNLRLDHARLRIDGNVLICVFNDLTLLYDADDERVDRLSDDIWNGILAAAVAKVEEANSAPSTLVLSAAGVTLRTLGRGGARPRPTKVRKYEGQPLAHAEDEAQ